MLKLVLLVLLVGQGAWAQRRPGSGQGAASVPNYKFTNLEIEIYKKILERNGDNSVTFSPFSIRTLLAMVKEGCVGKTKTDLEEAIGETSGIERVLAYPPRGGLTMGNVCYLSNALDINEQFKDTLLSKYHAEFQYADFNRPRSAAYNINEWVRRITNKGIQELIKPDVLSPESVFMMINAIHLSAKWKQPFDSLTTKQGVFYESEGNRLVPKLAPIMQQYGYFKMGQVESLNAKVIELPFITPDKHSMYIVLPNEKNGLKKLIQDLRAESLREILQSLVRSVELTLSLPKFKLSTTETLRTILPQKVASIFGANAQITGISHNNNVQLTDMLHRADLKVDEEGATGSAATAVHAVLLSNSPPLSFNASHPFLYFITQQTGESRYSAPGQFAIAPDNLEIYFMGHVSKLDDSVSIAAESDTRSQQPSRLDGNVERRRN
jgi:serine protease inhibitor